MHLASYVSYPISFLTFLCTQSAIVKGSQSKSPPSFCFSDSSASVGLAVSCLGSGNLPQCVSLGIVRGDPLRRVLCIITPVPQHLLEDVDLLLQGFIQIPTCLLHVQVF
ncbi:unnamed protein product [Lactuca saligna]|uniref:NOL9 C-terminal domain-containing protein n=1 Tax=Lactuca saligna TaxID=75948 RepID=A0AA35Y4I3_LACSI|nr:unnamed protein product [Lactuca saligna]